MLKKIFIFFFLIIIIIISFEIFDKLLSSKTDQLNNSRLYQIKNKNHYSPIFKNFQNTFLYEKNSKLTHLVHYGNHNQSTLVYKYDVVTNKFGLNSNLNAEDFKKEVILLLGASFAEGAGAKPWTDILNRNNEEMKILNAGLLGTSPGHWVSIGEYLINQEKISVSKILIIYTSDNLSRKEYNLPKPILECTQFYYFCKGWEIFIGYSYENNNNFVKEIYKWRDSKPIILSTGDIFQNLRLNLPATYKIYTFFNRYFRKIKNEYILHNFIKNTTKIPSLIIRIPLKEEITNPIIYKKFKFSYLSKGIHIDAQDKCHFNIEDYYELDEHFNPSGYQKLAKCIDTILHETK
jgi:hypothetical protein